jgi:hypothetical protein
MTITWQDVRHGAHAVGAGLTAAAPGIGAAGAMTADPLVVAGGAIAAGAGAFLSSLEKGGKVMRTQTARLHRGEIVVRPRDAPRVGNYMRTAGMNMANIK